MRNNSRDLATMVTAYVECLLWQGLDYYAEDEEPRPMDDNYDADDVAPDALRSIEADCRSFLANNVADLASIDAAQAGHDFCLTRNGHGTGFWDRGNGAIGDRLADACRPYGESGECVGDDGLIYV